VLVLTVLVRVFVLVPPQSAAGLSSLHLRDAVCTIRRRGEEAVALALHALLRRAGGADVHVGWDDDVGSLG